ncbi:MAG: response regulator [Alphaproteobacteria bacterium]|nr:response regulator [Alphaproteobacteria bacterium]
MADTSPHVLIVDDHRDIRDALSRYLQDNGLKVTMAESAASARRVLSQREIDLMVLDIMMPGEDGLSLCRSVREHRRTPVILLSARSEELDRIIGLEVGADDYVTKPFSPRELLARIHAVLRRTNELPPGQRPRTGVRMRFGAWVLHGPERQVVGRDGVVVSLSSTEFALLATFLEHPHIVLTRDQLLDRIKGRGADDVFDRSVDTQISRLRRKLEDDPRNPRLIKTSWGAGYLFASDVEQL